MTTRPLELEGRLRPPARGLDGLFFVDLAAIVVFFAIFGSPFVLAPGLTLDLPTVSARSDTPQPIGLVVNVQRDNQILFEDGLHSLASFEARLREMQRAGKAPTLLLRVDRRVSVQGLIDLCDAARAAGVERIQVASGRSEP